MHFVVDLTVTIGGKILTTVQSVRTKYDSTHIGSSIDIIAPLNSVIQYQDGRKDSLPSYLLGKINQLFKVGDEVKVIASYTTEVGINMGDVTLFTGQVYDFKLGTPCTIKCIDYLPLLQSRLTISAYTGTIKNLVEQVLKNTGISLILPTIDLTLIKIQFNNMTPWAILDYLKKNIGLNISLSGNQLYMNVASNVLDTVIMSSDTNVHRCSLQQPDTVWQGFRVKAWFIGNNSIKSSIEVGDVTAHTTEVYFYKVQGGLPVYNRLAAEALNKCRQRKYAGEVGAYLYPVVKLFDKIQWTNVRFPEQNGNYVVTAIEHVIDDNGAYVNMRWAFLVDFLNQVA